MIKYFFKCRDQFVLYKNGYGKVVGRLKDVIIRGGENIYPKEIEDFINTHPDVIESQVIIIMITINEESDVCVSLRLWQSNNDNETQNNNQQQNKHSIKLMNEIKYHVNLFYQFVNINLLYLKGLWDC